MSSADDILFEPFVKSDWRAQCRQLVDYIKNHKHAPRCNKTTGRSQNATHPAGALLLEEMCELFHENKQDIFWVVYVPNMGFRPVECREIFFNGKLTCGRYADGDCPRLATVSGVSIRDLNLVRSLYSAHYVFATRQQADVYLKDISS